MLNTNLDPRKRLKIIDIIVLMLKSYRKLKKKSCEIYNGPIDACRHGRVAEWSKALDLGSSLSGGVGSNPTAIILFATADLEDLIVEPTTIELTNHMKSHIICNQEQSM